MFLITQQFYIEDERIFYHVFFLRVLLYSRFRNDCNLK